MADRAVSDGRSPSETAWSSPGTYDTDTSGMARAHDVGEVALRALRRYVGDAHDPERVDAVASLCETLLEGVRVHHGAEDVVLYPRLEERCGEQRAVVRRVGLQHRDVDEQRTAVHGALDRWRSDPTLATSAELRDALSRFLDVFTLHCREEERVVCPLASRHLSTEEWEEMLPVERAIYRGDKPWLLVGLVLEQYDDVQRAAILARLGDEWRTSWEVDGSTSYDSFMAVVRG